MGFRVVLAIRRPGPQKYLRRRTDAQHRFSSRTNCAAHCGDPTANGRTAPPRLITSATPSPPIGGGTSTKLTSSGPAGPVLVESRRFHRVRLDRDTPVRSATSCALSPL